MSTDNKAKEIPIIFQYNNTDYNLSNKETNSNITYNLVKNNEYFVPIKNKKYELVFKYGRLKITVELEKSAAVLKLYLILQIHFKVDTLEKLSNLDWDFEKWKIDIYSIDRNKLLPDHLTLLNCFLNLRNNFNKPITIKELEEKFKLQIKDKRGLGGERPRELNYMYGYLYYTSSTKKSLKNSERLFVSPFPTGPINTQRKALVKKYGKSEDIKIKCFTCGCCDGDVNIFGNLCKFEKGHLTPIKLKNTTTALNQCKWCNSFYKDKVQWDENTGKPTFNTYAIMRDTKKKLLIKIIKDLGITSEDIK